MSPKRYASFLTTELASALCRGHLDVEMRQSPSSLISSFCGATATQIKCIEK